jgi:hypothetical protein
MIKKDQELSLSNNEEEINSTDEYIDPKFLTARK